MNKIGLVAAILTLFGCGEDEKVIRTPIPQDEPKCLSCGYIPPQDDYVPTEAAPRMDLSPSDLGFYFVLDYEQEYPPQYVVLTNLTKQSVEVTKAEIVVNESLTIGSSDSVSCFNLTEPMLPNVLGIGEQLRFEIFFSFSEELCGALFTVETSFDNPEPLVTELYGKVFNTEY